MKNTTEDLIMAEMHAIKDENSARFGHDIDRLFRHLQKEVAEMPSIKRRKQVAPGIRQRLARVAKTTLHA
jgi:hypothetical protein